MKWTVLVDNRTSTPALATEHGLSILLETERHRILLDTGTSDILVRNAERMGIDLGTVDYVFISHGHSDHAGGLKHFMAINDKAKVVVSPDALSGKFYSKRGRLHSITTTWPVIPDNRLIRVERSCEIADGIHVIARIPQVHPRPRGNQNLLAETDEGNIVLDDFRHELALYTEGVLFTGCAHSGLENILAASPLPIRWVVGGFHLLDGYESDEELTDLCRRLKTKYPDTHFFTGHCTGDYVFGVMKNRMGEYLRAFGCGYQDSDTVILHKKSFRDLTVDELYELLRARSEVFVVEQNCVYQDMDGDDQQSIHLWLTVEDKVVALARVCPAGTHMKEISIGRVITVERGKGYGRQIMLHAIDAAIEQLDAKLIDIEAQEYAKGFYEGVGFKQSSDTFMLDGIPHIKMTWIKK